MNHDEKRSFHKRMFYSQVALQRCFLRKIAVKIYSEFTGEHPCQSAISVKLLCNFFEIILWHGCSPVILLHVFKTYFYKNTSRRLLLSIGLWMSIQSLKGSITYETDVCKASYSCLHYEFWHTCDNLLHLRQLLQFW